MSSRNNFKSTCIYIKKHWHTQFNSDFSFNVYVNDENNKFKKKNNWKEYAAWFAHLKALNKKFSDQSYHYKVLLRQKSLQGRLWSSQLGYIIVHRYNMALSEQLCILKISSTVRVSWMLVWFSRLGSFVVFNPKARQASTVSGIHPSTICHQLMRTFRISDPPPINGDSSAMFSHVRVNSFKS